jgi:hypothetical protein
MSINGLAQGAGDPFRVAWAVKCCGGIIDRAASHAAVSAPV